MVSGLWSGLGWWRLGEVLGRWLVVFLVWICLLSSGFLAVGVSEWVVVVLAGEVDGAEACCPVRACEYSIVCCSVGARRVGTLVYVRNIAARQIEQGVS